MSHAPGVQADSTAERRGAAVSFATKEEAIAYIVSHAPARDQYLISPWSKAAIRPLHSEEDRWSDRAAPIACAPWLTPIGASAGKDVLSRNGLDNRTAAMRSQHADAALTRGAGPPCGQRARRHESVQLVIGSCALDDGARCERKHWAR